MKGQKIEIKDITSSPFFVIGVLVLVCILIVVGIVFITMDINNTKTEIIDARKMYEDNVKQVALLEELKVKSKAAEEQLEACEDILPDSLGDVYILEEDVIKRCQQFDLTVTSIEQTVAMNETQEVVFTVSVSGSYSRIYDYMNYYTNMEQVHRFDSLTLSVGEGDNYNATFTIAFLSENGAKGAVQAVVDEAVASATTTAAAS